MNIRHWRMRWKSGLAKRITQLHQSASLATCNRRVSCWGIMRTGYWQKSLKPTLVLMSNWSRIWLKMHLCEVARITMQHMPQQKKKTRDPAGCVGRSYQLSCKFESFWSKQCVNPLCQFYGAGWGWRRRKKFSQWRQSEENVCNLHEGIWTGQEGSWSGSVG